MYGTYAGNTEVLNSVLTNNGMTDEYYFYGNNKKYTCLKGWQFLFIFSQYYSFPVSLLKGLTP